MCQTLCQAKKRCSLPGAKCKLLFKLQYPFRVDPLKVAFSIYRSLKSINVHHAYSKAVTVGRKKIQFVIPHFGDVHLVFLLVSANIPVCLGASTDWESTLYDVSSSLVFMNNHDDYLHQHINILPIHKVLAFEYIQDTSICFKKKCQKLFNSSMVQKCNHISI